MVDPFSFYFKSSIDLREVTHYTTNKSFFDSYQKFYVPAVSLALPNLQKVEIYQLDEYAVDEIIDTIRLILKHCVCMTEDMKLKAFIDDFPIVQQLEVAKSDKNLDLFNAAIDTFNIKIIQAAEVNYVVGYLEDKAPNMFIKLSKLSMYAKLKSEIEQPHPELIEHIYYQCYSRIIEPKLNELSKYQAFSDSVYGEIMFSLTSQIIELTKINSTSIFLDLGSGIGNVVCQTAGITQCEAYGIEIMANSVELSFDMANEFQTRCHHFNQPCGKIHLFKGDIFNHPNIDSLLKRATVIFVNNHVFTSQTNSQLMQRFLDLQDGCLVVSIINFAPTTPLSSRITHRNVNHIESILHVTEHDYLAEDVSWSDEPGHFYIHRVDREPLKKFLSRR
eukprot:NODE_12_length_54577_cov_0.384100.p12 type:complete len:390 gc:universal NODE_12_length_54577_cov_0.384100:38661-39830(+)